MDFRNVTRLFADPDWDGPIEQDEEFEKGGQKDGGYVSEPTPGPGRYKPVVDANGCSVQIIHKTVSLYDVDGKLLRQESIVDYTKENILGEYASLDNFIQSWSKEEKKEEIKIMLLERGIDLELLKEDQNMKEVDDFDFICHVAFNRKPLSRRERANNVKKRDFFSKYSGVARQVLEALLEKYMNSGIYEIEKAEILQLDPFVSFGKPAKIASYFGGKEGYLKEIQELTEEIYAEAA
jgi:type I restriction enzyme R subunit